MDKNLSIIEKKKLAPILGKLNSYNFRKHEVRVCYSCEKKILHEVYDGHTFAEGLIITLCLNCGARAVK